MIDVWREMLLWPFAQLNRLWRWLGFESRRSQILLTVILLVSVVPPAAYQRLGIPNFVVFLSSIMFSVALMLCLHRALNRIETFPRRVYWRFMIAAGVYTSIGSLEPVIDLPEYVEVLTMCAVFGLLAMHHYAMATDRRGKLQGVGFLLGVGVLPSTLLGYEPGQAGYEVWTQVPIALMFAGFFGILVASNLTGRWLGGPVLWLVCVVTFCVLPFGMYGLTPREKDAVPEVVAVAYIAGWVLAWAAALAYVALRPDRYRGVGVVAW